MFVAWYHLCEATGIILGISSANERWRYIVALPLSGWAHTQIDPWCCSCIQVHMVNCWWPDAYLAPRHLQPSWWHRLVTAYQKPPTWWDVLKEMLWHFHLNITQDCPEPCGPLELTAFGHLQNNRIFCLKSGPTPCHVPSLTRPAEGYHQLTATVT